MNIPKKVVDAFPKLSSHTKHCVFSLFVQRIKTEIEGLEMNHMETGVDVDSVQAIAIMASDDHIAKKGHSSIYRKQRRCCFAVGDKCYTTPTMCDVVCGVLAVN